MTRSGYHIPDEPRPGALGHLAVRPFWPLLAMMTAGAWLSLPWFVLNAFAVGSPSKGREVAWAVAGLAGSALIAGSLLGLDGLHVLEKHHVPYLLIVPVVWKLFVAYRLQQLQARTLHLHEWYGGVVRNGVFVALAGGIFGRGLVLGKLGSVFWTLVLQ